MHFEKEYVSFDTAGFSKMFRAYIAEDTALKSLYNSSPQLSSFPVVMQEVKQRHIQRGELVKVLKRQYESVLLKTDSIKYRKAFEAIDSLNDEHTFTVCTGHQLCLFTGPLYFIYKIVSAIKLAAELKIKYSQYNFVPVYWMATEDHDFEEINHAHLFGKKLEWKKEEAIGANTPPSGKIKTSSLADLLQQTNQILGDSTEGNYLKQLFEKAYLQHDNLSDATRYLVHELFEEYGLVILDANEESLKRVFVPVVKEELLNPRAFALVNETSAYIEKNGFEVQVNAREINLFYATDNSRERIVFENEKYKVLNTSLSFSKEEIIKELENNPQAFSPNVILRPLYQQMVLPNLAYIGGAAEICYWLQFKSVFDHYDVQFPVLMSRNSALIVDEKSKQVFGKLLLKIEDVFLPLETLIKKVITGNSGTSISLEDIEQQLKEIYAQITERVAKIDKTLEPMVEAELHKGIKALHGMEAKMIRAEKLRQETTVTLATKLKEKFFPTGVLQERHDNFIPYYLKYGKDFIPALITGFDPFDNRLFLLKETH